MNLRQIGFPLIERINNRPFPTDEARSLYRDSDPIFALHAAFAAKVEDSGLVAKGHIVGMDVVEITPSTDVNQITCITAGRMIVNMVGAVIRTGRFDGRR